ncbi:NADH dehydrogenase [ubiquinone] 1 beta subcomplex subunit 7 [Balamuthia mandrillaris]
MASLKEGPFEFTEEEIYQKRVLPLTEEEMNRHNIPLGSRDFCADLLVTLTQCREHHFYLPWKCTHERHAYDSCEMKEAARRNKWYELEVAKEKDRLRQERLQQQKP